MSAVFILIIPTEEEGGITLAASMAAYSSAAALLSELALMLVQEPVPPDPRPRPWRLQQSTLPRAVTPQRSCYSGASGPSAFSEGAAAQSSGRDCGLWAARGQRAGERAILLKWSFPQTTPSFAPGGGCRCMGMRLLVAAPTRLPWSAACFT